MEASRLLHHGIFPGFPRIGHLGVTAALHRYTRTMTVAITAAAVATVVVAAAAAVVRVYFP